MFTELKCKTNFSFLRGASSAAEYIQMAHLLGMQALALTDINGVYALPRAYEAIQKHFENTGKKLKLIAGSELTLSDGHPPITLLAKTRRGYGLMCRILTALHADREKGEGQISFAQLSEILEAYPFAPELICLPTLTKATNLEILHCLFPNIYLPLCRYLDGLDAERTALALELSERYQVQLVATNDVHYHAPDRRPLQDSMTCIREGKSIDDAGFLLFGNQERYLKSGLQMRALFSDLPQALENSHVIEQQCTFCLSELKYSYPNEFIPTGHTAKSYLEELVYKAADVSYKGIIPQKAALQIRRELDFFAKRGDEHYFLTVHDIVRFAREKNIICQGRGSAANSIVCYVLGITSVDPVHMNLLFDRFMNDGRKEPPDIDIDFEHERREEVIQYIYNRFGRDRAAMVGAVHTYRSRGAFRELCKAVGIDVGTLSAGELENRFDEVAKDKKNRRELVTQLSKQMKGFPRHLSTHSGGFVLSNDPLIEMVPIEPARRENRTIIQWDKDDLETLGLMKIDILSIGFLTALHKACDAARIDWRDIPPDDLATFKMIQRAETHGTFQIESRAQMSMLTQTLPRNYYDLVVQVALVRPSPTVGGMVQPFIKGLFEARRGNPFRHPNKKLEAILGRTYGVPIFQEQIMQISIDVAGFTPAEADQLRRSMGLQRTAETINIMGEKLRAALLKSDVSEKFAADLFEYIKGYAHYGFPESHSASYASLAYKSAYMKCHYPAELVCALINSMPMGFYSEDTLIAEAKRNSAVKFLPLHPNFSDWDAKIEHSGTVRMGFSQLRGAREADVLHMMHERTLRAFDSTEDFIFRTGFSREVIEGLALANAFECFGVDRRHAFWRSIEFASLNERGGRTGNDVSSSSARRVAAPRAQLSLFNESTQFEQNEKLFTPMRLIDEIQIDHRHLGYSLHGNMMKALRKELPHLPRTTSTQVKRTPVGRTITYAGILTVFQKPPPAKGTAFITLEDEFGSVDAILKKEIYDEFADVIKQSRFLIFTGRQQQRGTGTTLIVSDVRSFAQHAAKKLIGAQQSLGVLNW